MSKAPLPDDELERLLALYRYDILDQTFEKEMSAFVRLARTITGASVAVVNLIDRDRQWQTCAIGMTPGEFTRDESMCAHTIAAKKPIHVADCTKDSRFVDNAFVDGTIGNVRMYASAPLITPDGFAIGSLCTVDDRPFEIDDEALARLADLADQLVSVLELRRSTKALAQANKELDAFAGTVAHDLRNPLCSIGGYAEMLADQLEDAQPVVQKLLANLAGTTVRMEEMLEGVLNHSRSDRGELTWDTVDLNRVAMLARENLFKLVTDHRAIVRIELLPVINGDAVQLSQLFQNLIANAIRHTAEFGRPEVTVSVTEDQQTWVLHVDDKGKGVAAGDRERIFGAFERNTNATNGHGLGLATCQRIAERHGGSIWVEEGPGGGARFSVRVPKSYATSENLFHAQNQELSINA